MRPHAAHLEGNEGQGTAILDGVAGSNSAPPLYRDPARPGAARTVTLGERAPIHMQGACSMAESMALGAQLSLRRS
jgi:hypothetical protein